MAQQAPRFSAHLGYLFTDRPFFGRIDAARNAGFAAVEHPAPYDVPAADLARQLKQAGLTFAQLALRAGDASRGEKGLAIFPDRREEFRSSVEEGLAYAEAVGAKLVHVMAGKLPEGSRTSTHRETYCENLVFAADAAHERGIRVILEAFSPGAMPDYYLASATDAIRIVRQLGHPNVGILLDVFHATSVGEAPEDLIRENPDLVWHLHLADHPDRHEPGTGTIDFASLMEVLHVAGYEGLLGCEYIPAAATEDGLGWMTEPWALGGERRRHAR